MERRQWPDISSMQGAAATSCEYCCMHSAAAAECSTQRAYLHHADGMLCHGIKQPLVEVGELAHRPCHICLSGNRFIICAM